MAPPKSPSRRAKTERRADSSNVLSLLQAVGGDAADASTAVVDLGGNPLATGEDQKELPASPDHCRVSGFGNSTTVNTTAEFMIEACDKNGTRVKKGGDAFFIAIRGASRVRGRVTDNQDGTYIMSWKPIVSGQYSVVVSLFGYSIAGSPFTAYVNDPSPFAPNC